MPHMLTYFAIKYQAECEAEAEITEPSYSNVNNSKNRDDDDDGFDNFSMTGDDDSDDNNNNNNTKKTVEIRADHIAKIAAELLLDLS